MAFLQGVTSLPCRLVHHTGTMIRFTTGQLGQLPLNDEDCFLELPDGAVVRGHFRRHPDNPYIGGSEIVRWIKSWVPYNAPANASVYQVGTGNRIRLAVAAPATHVTAEDDATKHRVVSRARKLSRIPESGRRRRSYEAWERDPYLRTVALSAWGTACQVTDCTFLATVPTHILPKMVDVHHLNHVSRGGTDSPLNICILCVVHHQLIHRAPSSVLQSWDLDGSTVTVNGLTLKIIRDARAIM